MKRTAIFAMLAVFALLATPLLTTNASAVIDEREMTTGADCGYFVYGDANGNMVCVSTDNGDVIGGEWYGGGDEVPFNICEEEQVYGGAYPADAVEMLGEEPNQYPFIIFKDGSDGKTYTFVGEEITTFGTNENSYTILGTGNLYEEVDIKPIRLDLG